MKKKNKDSKTAVFLLTRALNKCSTKELEIVITIAQTLIKKRNKDENLKIDEEKNKN